MDPICLQSSPLAVKIGEHGRFSSAGFFRIFPALWSHYS